MPIPPGAIKVPVDHATAFKSDEELQAAVRNAFVALLARANTMRTVLILAETFLAGAIATAKANSNAEGFEFFMSAARARIRDEDGPVIVRGSGVEVSSEEEAAEVQAFGQRMADEIHAAMNRACGQPADAKDPPPLAGNKAALAGQLLVATGGMVAARAGVESDWFGTAVEALASTFGQSIDIQHIRMSKGGEA